MKSPTLTQNILAASFAAVFTLAPYNAQAGSAAYNALVDAEALVHLSFDEISGSVADNTGTSNLDYTYGTGVTLGAASLEGLGTSVQNTVSNVSTGYVAFSGQYTYDLATALRAQDFTVELWFNASDLTSRQDIFGTNYGGIFINTNGAGSIQYFDGSSIATSAGVFSADTWNLLDVVYSGATDTATIYLNGVELVSGAASTENRLFGDPWWGNLVGANLNAAALGTNFEFSGKFDEFALYGKALTTSDMTERVSLAAVPEPSTWAAIVGGAGMLALSRHARRRK